MLYFILSIAPYLTLPLFPFIIFSDYNSPKDRYKAYYFLGAFYITTTVILPILMSLGIYFLPTLLLIPCFLFGIALRKPKAE